jgi:beta-galactosidase
VRLPKEAYYTYRVLQNDQPDLHILGHWTYPAGTTKTMYVISNCDAIDLLLNNKPLAPRNNKSAACVFAFPSIQFTPGTLKAIGYKNGVQVCSQELTTAGPPAAVKLTPILSPNGGLHADGADVALFDVEVVDSSGRRCPTDEARIDFTLTGPANWRGGYNSGILSSTNNLYLNTECGINRVSLRATRTPGAITLTAQRPGLTPASVTIQSSAYAANDGLVQIE